MERKRALYKGIFRTLRPGGVFVNADVTMSAHPVTRQEQCYRIWAGHLVSCGIDERRAYEHFDEWASEDTYFPLDEAGHELERGNDPILIADLRAFHHGAGFHAELFPALFLSARPDLTLNVPGGNPRIPSSSRTLSRLFRHFVYNPQ